MIHGGYVMSRKTVVMVVLCLIGLAIAAREAGQSRSGASAQKVKVQVAAGKPEAGTQAIALTLTIDPGWHIYANPCGNKDYPDNQTTLAVASPNKLAAVRYPPGKDKMIAGQPFKVYEGKVEIRAVIQRAANNGRPVELSLVVNACNKTSCLPQGTIKISMP
jgi:DsbC/DsbD-like thiol-disulfide interchange protein